MKRRLADISSSSEAKKPKGHWSAGLHSSMEDPEMTVFKDDKLVVIKDKFPKVKRTVSIG